MNRPLTHDHCAQRVCCPSWSCGPHMADCEIVTGRHRAAPRVMHTPCTNMTDEIGRDVSELLSKTRAHGGHGRAA